MRRFLTGIVLALAAGVAGAQGTAAPPVQVVAPVIRPTGEMSDLLTSGRQSLQNEKWVEAAALFEKAFKLDPASQEAMFGLAAADIQLEKYADALPLLEALHQQRPDNAMVKNNLAWIYAKSKDPAIRNPALAIKLARDAVLDAPADNSVWNTLAEAYYANGQFDRALRSAQSALRLSQLAGVTNAAASRELVARCRKAAGASEGDNLPTDR